MSIYTCKRLQQIKDLKNKIEELTQALETIILKIELIYKNL